eukprot:s4189_g2.t1
MPVCSTHDHDGARRRVATSDLFAWQPEICSLSALVLHNLCRFLSERISGAWYIRTCKLASSDFLQSWSVTYPLFFCRPFAAPTYCMFLHAVLTFFGMPLSREK